MKVRTNYPQIDYRTQMQWAKAGKIVNDNAAGTLMWSNGYCQQAFTYFCSTDVHDGTAEELEVFFAPIRAKQREQRAAAKQRKLQEAQKEQAQQIKNAEMEAKLSLVRNFLSDIAARSCVQAASPRSKVIVLDTETTGLDAADEIVQISIIDEQGHILLNTLVHPYYHSTWPDAERIHGITPDMVANAPYPHELLPTITKILSETSRLVGYSTNFDLGFLQNWGIHPSDIEIIDVMLDFADYYAENEWPYGNYKCHKPTYCADYFGFAWPGNAHNSLHDALATLHCYKKLYSQSAEMI